MDIPRIYSKFDEEVRSIAESLAVAKIMVSRERTRLAHPNPETSQEYGDLDTS
jgi:hypothetical protein